MSDVERIPTHIEGLDENMQGGVPQGHICIVAGASGAMKSSLTFSMLYNAVLYGETSGIYVTLEQGKDSLRSHMANMGMNVDDARVRNRIAIIDLSDLRVELDKQGMSDRVDWMGQLIKQLTSTGRQSASNSWSSIPLGLSSHSRRWRTLAMRFSDSLRQFVDSA